MSFDDGFATCCLLSFNRPQFVRQAIETATENAGIPVEMIVHDDGSDLETVELLLALRDRGLISTLILNPRGHNQGQGIALNRMFQMAKGDPIVKMDHDLLFRPNWLAESRTVLDLNEHRVHEPHIGALGLFKYEADPVDHRKMFIKAHEGWEEHEDFVGSAMVISRRAWEIFGPFEERSPAFAEDAVFKQRIRESQTWCNALLPHDMAINQGFGPGPSTVVKHGEGGEIVVEDIVDGPWVISR